MIGAVIGIGYAVMALAIWCAGAYSYFAHAEALDRRFDFYDLGFSWTLITIFTGLLWPIGIPVMVATLLGAKANTRKTAKSL